MHHVRICWSSSATKPHSRAKNHPHCHSSTQLQFYWLNSSCWHAFQIACLQIFYILLHVIDMIRKYAVFIFSIAEKTKACALAYSYLQHRKGAYNANMLHERHANMKKELMKLQLCAGVVVRIVFSSRMRLCSQAASANPHMKHLKVWESFIL